MLATPELIAAARQRQRLAHAVPQSLNLPLYRRMEAASLPEPGAFSLEHFHRLPLITKEDIRRNFPHNFLGETGDVDSLVEREIVELEHTSGTSEQRTPLLLPRGWWARQEVAALRLNAQVARLLDQEPQARRATLNSPACSSEVSFHGVPSCAERQVGSTLFLSLSRYPFLWSEADLARMGAEALAWQPRFLDVDPVYGVVFALYCERKGIRLPSVRFILCSYEFVSVIHRRILQRAFGVPVFNLYGSTETGHLLMEDETGRLRASRETAFLELVHAEGPVGDLVVTTLTNDVMPLVRYRIGDLVEAREEPYGTEYVVHGRAMNAFTAPASGRRVTTFEIDQCFSGCPGVAQYHLAERQAAPWLLRYVPEGPGPSVADLNALRERLSGLLGPPQGLALQATDALLPESSGKFRLGTPTRNEE